MYKLFALGLAALTTTSAAHARVYSLPAFQEIPPVEENGSFLRSAAGIDGNSIIIVNTLAATALDDDPFGKLWACDLPRCDRREGLLCE